MESAYRQPRNEQLPDAGLDALAHRVAAPVPTIEVSHYRHALGIGRPNGETHAQDAVDFHHLRAEAAAQLLVSALSDQVKVEFTQQQPEAIRVLSLLHQPARPVDAQAIGGAGRNPSAKQARCLHRRQLCQHDTARVYRLDRLSRWYEGAHHGLPAAARCAVPFDRMRTQERERVRGQPAGQCLRRVRIDL